MPMRSASSAGGRGATRTVYRDADQPSELEAVETVGRAFAEAVNGDADPETAAARRRLLEVVRRHPDSGLCKVPILEEMVDAVAGGVFGERPALVRRVRETVIESLWADAQNRRRLGRVWEQLQEQAGHV